MKHLTLLGIAVAAGITLPAMNAMATEFGGGWKHDKHTGTLHWSLAPDPVTHHQVPSHGKPSEHANSSGGSWSYDEHTDTVYWSLAPDAGGDATVTHRRQTRNPDTFGRGWAHDPNTGTLSYNPANYGDRQETAYD